MIIFNKKNSKIFFACVCTTVVVCYLCLYRKYEKSAEQVAAGFTADEEWGQLTLFTNSLE
jgi:hypothetical protein